MNDQTEEIKGFSIKPAKETWRQGYIVPVRNRLNDMIEKEFLPIEFKDKYIERWGENIIYDDEFIDWYCDLKKEEG